jgi:hypothetical protein
MIVSVRIEDHSERIKLLIEQKLGDLCEHAAELLAEQYKERLGRQEAPPHSRAGRTPYAYNGWKPGGFGPVNQDTTVNNIPPFFSAVQQESLYTYISTMYGSIGFLRKGHVTKRDQNYLLYYSIRQDSARREWVVKEYRQYKKQLVSQLRQRMKENLAARGGQSATPF